MTDRELLEAAARAAGKTVQHGTGSQTGMVFCDGVEWNPLTDDGDALRLAVKLQIDLIHFPLTVRADVDGLPDVHEAHGTDPYAATRRCIVRAAAEIGNGIMPFPTAEEIRKNWT